MDNASLVKAFLDTIARIPDPKVGMELQSLLNLLQADIARLQDEHGTLADENRRLQSEASERANIAEYKQEKNAYWKDGVPYCLHCMEEHRKARTLLRCGEHSSGAACLTCEKKIGGVFDFTPSPTMAERQAAARERRGIRRNY